MPPPMRPHSALASRNGVAGMDPGARSGKKHAIPTSVTGVTAVGAESGDARAPLTSRPTSGRLVDRSTTAMSHATASAGEGASSAVVGAGPCRTWRASTLAPPTDASVVGVVDDTSRDKKKKEEDTVPLASTATTTHRVEEVDLPIATAIRLTNLRASIADLKRQLAVELARRDDAERSLANAEAAAAEAVAREATFVPGGGGGGEGAGFRGGDDAGAREDKENVAVHARERKLDNNSGGGCGQTVGSGGGGSGARSNDDNKAAEAVSSGKQSEAAAAAAVAVAVCVGEQSEAAAAGHGGAMPRGSHDGESHGGGVAQEARARLKRANEAAAHLEAAVASERRRLKRLEKEVKVRLKKLREEGERGDKAAAAVTAAEAALVKAKSQASVAERKARESAPALLRELEKERAAAEKADGGEGSAASSSSATATTTTTKNNNNGGGGSGFTSAARAKSTARAEVEAAETAVAQADAELESTRRELERSRREHRELEQTAARFEEAAAQERAERSHLVSSVDSVTVGGAGGGLGARGGADAAAAAGIAGAAAEAAKEAAEASAQAGAARAAAAAAAAKCRRVRCDVEDEERAAARDLSLAISALAAAECEGRPRVASLAARALTQRDRLAEALRRLTNDPGGVHAPAGDRGGTTPSRKSAHGGTSSSSKPSEAQRDDVAAAARELAGLISAGVLGSEGEGEGEGGDDAASDQLIPLTPLTPPPLLVDHPHRTGDAPGIDSEQVALPAAMPFVCQLCRSDPYVDTSIISGRGLARELHDVPRTQGTALSSVVTSAGVQLAGERSRGGGGGGGGGGGYNSRGGGGAGDGSREAEEHGPVRGVTREDKDAAVTLSAAAAAAVAAAEEHEAAGWTAARWAELEAGTREMRVNREGLSAAVDGAKRRRDADASYAKELSRDLIGTREKAARARASAATHSRRFASSAEFEREWARAEAAAASLAKTKEDTKRHKERAAVNKEALADLDAAIHAKLVEHVRRERAAGAVKEESAAVARELAAARRLLREYSAHASSGADRPAAAASAEVTDAVAGGRAPERQQLGGGGSRPPGGDPQWRRVRELEEELSALRAKAEEGKRELRRAERDVHLAEARAAARRRDTASRAAAKLHAAEQAALRAGVEAAEARREEREAAEAAAEVAGRLAEVTSELAALEAEGRAVGADLRYLTAWRDKHAPKRGTLVRSPVVVVDIQPDVDSSSGRAVADTAADVVCARNV